ncbi:MAG: M23 family metallopeptidase [Rikenellaceae bacterium]
MKRIILYVFTLLTPLFSVAQEYASPLGIDLLLSSNFGELRTNHFHSGLDFKTGGVEGENVYSVESGYVSRIFVSPTGYGHALYIAHPSKGTTTVYGHLRNFSPEIEEYVRKYQYRNKKFSVDIYPEKTVFPVEKGQKIAESGNTGSSGGPHLHFEIRNSSNEPINVVKDEMFMVKNSAKMVKDEEKPGIHSVSFVRIDTVKGVPIHTTYKKFNAKKVGGKYKLSYDTIRVEAPSYFVIEVSERKTASTNIYGIYSMKIERSGKPYFSFAIDKFSFTDTRYVNTLLKFPETDENRNDKIRTYVSPNNNLKIYGTVASRGVIKPQTIDGVEPVFVEICDDSGNKSQLEFSIYAQEKPNAKVLSDKGTPVWWKKGATIKEGDVSVEIPAYALYESELVDITVLPKVEGTVIERYVVGNKDVKLQKSYTLAFDISSVDESDRSKLKIVSMKSGKVSYSAGGTVSGDKITLKTTNFGEYSLAIDKTAPTITPQYKSQESQAAKSHLSFKISDNLSGINTYNAIINGKWALLEFDSKTATIRHPLKDGIAQKGANTIEVTVTDASNNKKTYSGTFLY